jgi:stage II sporulation protein D
VHRRRFLTALTGLSAGGYFFFGSRARGQTTDLSAPLRVRLFAGLSITRLVAGGSAIDVPTRTLTTGGVTKPLGDEVVALSGTPYLDTVASAKNGETIQRSYPGTLFAQLRGDELFVLDQVDVETYVASVMSAEVSPGWAVESLRAQAIAVRTYAARTRLSHATRDYDLNDDTSNQVYRGIAGVAPSLVKAASDTAGQIVVWANAPASVFYSSSCGGHTAASIELTGQPSPPYLGGVPDLDQNGRAYCSGAPYFRWKNDVAVAPMARIVDMPAEQLNAISISDRWPDGRVKTVSATGSSFTVTLAGREFYQRALGVLGYKVIPSALFDLNRDGSNFALVGHGVGHGVGMCQWGARGRADAGMSAAQILQAYFPGTSIAHV